MLRAIPTKLWTLSLLCSLVFWGCATTQNELQRRAGAPIASAWHIDIPARFRSIEVASTPDCVLLFGRTPIDAVEPERLMQCLNPDTGVPTWTRLFPVNPGLLRDEFLTGPGTIVYRSFRRVIGVDVSTGQTAWTFDPGGRVIDSGVVHHDRIYLSMNSKNIVTIDVETGAWLSGHSLEGHSLLGISEAPGGPTAIVMSKNDEGSLGLAALDLTTPGAQTPAPPFPEPQVIWRREPHPGTTFHVLGDRIVGLSKTSVTSIAADSGQTLHTRQRRRRAAPVKSVRGRGMKSFPRDEPGLSMVDPSTLEFPTVHLPEEGTIVGNSAIYTHRLRDGLLVDRLQIDSIQPRDFSTIWSSAWSAGNARVTLVELPHLRAVLVARPVEVRVLDIDTGATLGRTRINPMRTGWTGIASDLRGLYVLYGHDPVPRLEAVPWTTPEVGSLP